MDDKDRILLTILEDDSNIPVRNLSEMADLSEEEVATRIRILEEQGVIRKYRAVVDWEQAGEPEVAAIIELKVSPERDFGYDKIAERIARFSQVRSIRLISGVYDLQVMVVGSNIHEITSFVAEQIAPMDHIRETATILIMKTYKENGHTFFERGEATAFPFHSDVIP
ncbi:MAG TPA: Lrp/AsnC family transcriptional regulator [Methanoculleus sp.]|nr:Lrp/AsnC family transcriptional regulator [Methanoculleus sp.]